MAQYGSEVLALELAAVLEHARPARLSGDRVRVDRRDVARRIDRLTKAVRVEVDGHGLDEAVGSHLVRAADELRSAAIDRHSLGLTGRVSLRRSTASGVATALRAATQL
jgi:hypothetical protein